MFAPPRRAAAPLAALALAAGVGLIRADGPADNVVEKVRPIPPKGTELPAAVAAELRKGLAELQQLITDVGPHALLPDVQVYEKAVRWALDHDEVFDPKPGKDGKGPPPGANVRKVLAAGLERAKQLKAGQAPWTTQTGGVLRGYKSRIDGSVQPYWLIVPKEYDFAGNDRHRLDFWWHGRGEMLTEANFMAKSPGAGDGIIAAPGALILHPYGRYCNANKFAGEVDTFECLQHARKHYGIDESRLVARGFSMGGAACWQFGVHYPTLWAACAPGAGFSETPEFLKVFQKEDVKPTWYEQKLWRMYNATDYAQNIFNLPTVAYSGEIDSQKQAADVMAREMKKLGLELTHVIGPRTGHSYEAAAKAEVNKRIDALVKPGRPGTPRAELKFVTYTLRYNQCDWVTVEGLEKHWEPATVHAQHDGGTFAVTTENITALTVRLPRPPAGLVVDKQEVALPAKPPVPFVAHVRKGGGKWQAVRGLEVNALRKAPGLQGPIDDAFLESFVMVKPTGKPIAEKVGKWADAEFKHAVTHWRQQFRGDAPVKDDTAVTDADIRNCNLILWGDPQSNKVLAKLAESLPIRWADRAVVVGDKAYDGDAHAPILIYPNPLNPTKYVLLNSGFTFREYDYLNNARQVPKLPDYAVVDVTTPPNARYPGKVVRAGFFDEQWQLAPNDGQ